MKRRALKVVVLLLLAAGLGSQWAALRDYPKGYGDFLDSPDGAHYAALIYVEERKPFSAPTSSYILEVGPGPAEEHITHPGQALFTRKLPLSAIPQAKPVEQLIRWSEDGATVEFRVEPEPVSWQATGKNP